MLRLPASASALLNNLFAEKRASCSETGFRHAQVHHALVCAAPPQLAGPSTYVLCPACRRSMLLVLAVMLT